MAHKAIRRLRTVSSSTEKRLNDCGIRTLKDLLRYNEFELLGMVNLPPEELSWCVKAASKVAAPKPRTALELSKQSQPTVSTRIAELDRALHGGIPSGSITEVVGPAGAGKTQFCMTLTCNSVLDSEDGSAIYIDTEGSFSPQRCLQMLTAMVERADGSANDDRIIKKMAAVHYYRVESSEELVRKLENLESVIIDNNVRLLVVDSVATHVRREFDRSMLLRRQELLTSVASNLKYLTETFQIPCVVTNQVTSAGFGEGAEGFVTAALGNTWSHCVNNRIALECRSICRLATLAKSPIAQVCSYRYKITNAGVEEDLQGGTAIVEQEHNFWSSRLREHIEAVEEEEAAGNANDEDRCNDIIPAMGSQLVVPN